MRLRQRHGAEEAAFEHRRQVALFLLGRRVLGQQLGGTHGQQRVVGDRDVGRLEPEERRVGDRARQPEAAVGRRRPSWRRSRHRGTPRAPSRSRPAARRGRSPCAARWHRDGRSSAGTRRRRVLRGVEDLPDAGPVVLGKGRQRQHLAKAQYVVEHETDMAGIDEGHGSAHNGGDCGARPRGDQAVGLGPTVLREIEDRRLVGDGQIEIAARDDQLIAERRRHGHVSPDGAMICDCPICCTPSSTPALATPTTQVPF